MIHIHQFSYAYPNQPDKALQDVSLHVPPGEFAVVVGLSGSGKSTLLRCLNGLVPHFSGGRVWGEVQVNGLDAIALGPQILCESVGFVLQNPEAQAVLDTMEAEIAFGLENRGVPRPEMRLRVEEVLDLLGLAGLRERPLRTLSGGERQKVAIASVMVLRPQVLVLDEPTSQLDPQSAEDVLAALVRLNEELGLTILLAEHRLERVLRFADRLIYLDKGRVMSGPVQEMLAHLPHVPPLVALGKRLGWSPLPLTVKEARLRKGQLPQPSLPQLPQPTAPAKPTALEIKGLSFGYGGKQPLLKGVDVTVAEGEVVVLMGRNGAGKSTLLRCVVGLLKANAGQVRVNGRSVNGRSTADICQSVGYLPQNPDDLLFAESVREELAITLQNHHLPTAGLAHDPIADLLAQLHLTHVAAAYPRDLSVGQRQRVALGAVTITQPRLLLLDEPTRGLDYAAKESLVALWRTWQAQGMGLLLVTHDVELAAQVADRVVVLAEGEVIAAGPARQILPASPLFAPQMARLFPNQGVLTLQDVLLE